MLAPLLGASGGSVPPTSWTLLAALVLSGLATVVAMTRAGINAFWASPERAVPRVGLVEIAPVLLLLAACLALTVQAGPVMRYLQATAEALHAPQGYVQGVLPTPPAAGLGDGIGR
jgi:multicomponent K+:H+ antiporter subunit D